jgi:hypothetical protein
MLDTPPAPAIAVVWTTRTVNGVATGVAIDVVIVEVDIAYTQPDLK